MKPGKRIITTNNEKGRSHVSTTDAGVRFDMPDVDDWFSVEYWSTSKVPVDPSLDDGLDPNQVKLMPEPGGCIFRMCQFPAHNKSLGEDVYQKVWQHVTKKEIVATDQNLVHPMMHNTKTVDYGIVLSGEVTLILDEEEVDLVPGDVVIQRSTNHAWDNKSDQPCLMAFILFAADSK